MEQYILDVLRLEVDVGVVAGSMRSVPSQVEHWILLAGSGQHVELEEDELKKGEWSIIGSETSSEEKGNAVMSKRVGSTW